MNSLLPPAPEQHLMQAIFVSGITARMLGAERARKVLGRTLPRYLAAHYQRPATVMPPPGTQIPGEAVEQLGHVIAMLAWVPPQTADIIWERCNGITWRKIAKNHGMSDVDCEEAFRDGMKHIIARIDMNTVQQQVNLPPPTAH